MKTQVRSGIENLETVDRHLRGKRIGLITNPSAIDHDGNPTLSILHEKYTVTGLFGPEHGVYGIEQAGDTVNEHRDPRTGILVHSLYGDNLHLTREMVKDIDIIVFDIQDAGARFYTFLYTLGYAIADCRELGIPLLVLDRVNPIGGSIVEGTLLDTKYRSFVGEFPIPTRFGLTVGEYATYINATQGIGCELLVAPVSGWKRELFQDETDVPFVAPSPNIPTVSTALLFVGTCLFEGTNVSEGRGTTQPFELVGAPWMDGWAVADRLRRHKLPGLVVRPAAFRPTFHKYKGEVCFGVQLHIADRREIRPFLAGLYLLETIREIHPDRFTYRIVDGKEDRTHFNNLLGEGDFSAGSIDADRLLRRHGPKVDRYWQDAQKYLLY